MSSWWRRSASGGVVADGGEDGTESTAGASEPVMTTPSAPLVPADCAASADPAADASADPVAERAALIELCLYALDRAKSPGVTARLEAGLAEVGVTALRPDGERFDPAAHEAGGAVATSDAELEGLVAETELVGFADRGVVLRVPIVTVYRL